MRELFFESSDRLELLKGSYQSHIMAVRQVALQGWNYSFLHDQRFLAAKAPQVQQVQMAARNKVLTSDSECEAPSSSLRHKKKHWCDQVLKRLQEGEDFKKTWQAFSEATEDDRDDNPSLWDDFSDVTDGELVNRLKSLCNGKLLNVIILGAGPVGLIFANYLKNKLDDGANILVIEPRVKRLHRKLPYSREWPLCLGLQSLTEGVDPRIVPLLDRFGVESFAGATLCKLESLLYWSCCSLGVNFLFQSDYDLDFVEESQYDLVVDATGGRLNKSSISDKCRTLSSSVAEGPHWSKEITQGQFTFLAHHEFEFPRINNVPIQLGMLKIRDIPLELHTQMEQFVQDKNDDHLFYFWQNKLTDSLNRTMVLINLDAATYEIMRLVCPEICSLAQLLQDKGPELANLDGRILALLKFIECAGAAESSVVEPPFFYQPYIRRAESLDRSLYGRPILPLGDSIYSGNPKVGNGLPAHLIFAQNYAQLLVQMVNLSNK